MKGVRLSMVLAVLLAFVQLAGAGACGAYAAAGVIRQGVFIPYEITGPEGWSYNAQPHEYVLGVFKPDEDSLYPYISLTMMGGPFSEHYTPEQLVELNLYERPGARLLSSRWIEREEGRYLLTEFGWSSEMGEIHAIKAFHPRGRSVLVVSAVCRAGEFEQYQQLFLDSVMSVRVKKHPDAEEDEPVDGPAGHDGDWLYDD